MVSGDTRVIEEALTQLHEYHPELRCDGAFDKQLAVINRRVISITAPQHQLLRVVAGAGTLVSDSLEDPIDYGYWLYVPKGVHYVLEDRVIQGQHLCVTIQPLK